VYKKGAPHGLQGAFPSIRIFVCLNPKKFSSFSRKNPINEYHKKTLSWYKNHFLHCKKWQIKSEFSAEYFYDKEAPRLIKKYFPDIKLIVCLRNPIDRAYSQYWMVKNSEGAENRSFKEAIKSEKEYTERGMYYKQLTNYLKYFSKDQILIVLFDDIVSNPKSVLKQILNFLKVDSSKVESILQDKINTSKKRRFMPFTRITGFISGKLLISLKMSLLVRFLKKIGVKKAIAKLTTSPFRYPKMDSQLREHLKQIFRSDIQNLEKLIKSDLTHWL